MFQDLWLQEMLWAQQEGSDLWQDNLPRSEACAEVGAQEKIPKPQIS